MLDYYNVLDLMTSVDRQVQQSAREFLDSEMRSHVSEWWENGDFPGNLPTQLG